MVFSETQLTDLSACCFCRKALTSSSSTTAKQDLNHVHRLNRNSLVVEDFKAQINLNYQQQKGIMGWKMEQGAPSICLNYVLLLLCQRIVLYIFPSCRTQWRDKWGPFGANLRP